MAKRIVGISTVVARTKTELLRNVGEQRALSRGLLKPNRRRKSLWQPGTAFPHPDDPRILVVRISKLHPKAKFLAIYVDIEEDTDESDVTVH